MSATTTVQQGSLLDVLKKKMRQTKEEMEKYKDECEEFQKRFQLESRRREEVSLYRANVSIWGWARIARTISGMYKMNGPPNDLRK